MKIGNTQNTNETLVNLNKAKEEEKESLKKIASPRPIEATDGASLAIANALLAQANSMSQGIRNANDALGVLQIADGALSTISDSAIRMNELSVALGNPALNSDQRAMIESEANALTQSMDDAVSQATFNGKNVFGGQMSFMLGSGSVDFNLQSPNTSGLQVTNQESILNFINNVSSKRGDIGAVMNRIQSSINNDMNSVVNLKAAESNLQKNDLAENYNELNTAKLKENAALYASSFNTNYLQNRLDALLG
ncbi:flagellin [Helicobacter valdiviensis]|uniref:Flagellin n=1 Tax=Helicobacter valdiviensis TaxID=1458358 RepID=A0A2W6NHL4_9HELI|nr:flagellin [Helicobacter valdiviensis]PZT48350.1 flagellin [Helicobacter valdiviensis]